MKQRLFSEHWLDDNENPAGGVSNGTGFTISWQNGPLGRDNERKEPNGAFVEDVLFAIADRIEFYQSSKFNCADNAEALEHITRALECLDRRTKDREQRKVEGTHKT